MVSLADKIRRQREVRVPAGRFTFIVRRPTALQMDEVRPALRDGSTRAKAHALLPFVVGWDSVTEGDVLAGGAGHPLPFDAEVCVEWLEDAPELLGAVLQGVVDAFTAHQQRAEAAAGN
jgi:hypothetical protein